MRTLAQIQNEIQEDNHRFFPEQAENLGHHVLALCGEVGEVANLIKKFQRGSIQAGDENAFFDLAGELADVFIYVMSCAAIIGIDMEEIYAAKREYNVTRFEGTL